ncbi:NAD-dependent epimerase/dehydratase family protein [Demequina maris]|uniref:NAD-dependent epimerase/dehydratase family protein n=1 Tax=Demequina maris TaxID=1638982 RepID=UPI0009E1D757|nr:NAD(P)-dependent oxidoreductase [Demequina maris]
MNSEMRVIVTGGSGFIGTNLLEALKSHASVLNLDTSPPRGGLNRDVWRDVSVLDAPALRAEFRGFRPTHVVHLGARTDLNGNSVREYETNTTGVRNVVEAVAEVGDVAMALYASSRLVFAIGHSPSSTYDYLPSTYYGESKVAGELIVRETAASASPWALVRPTSIWGPWFGTPYRDFFDMIAAGRYVNFIGHEPRKSFGYVGNAVHQIQALLGKDPHQVNGRALWLSDYEPLVVSEWAALICDRLNRRHPRRVPWALGRAAAFGGDVLSALGVDGPPLTSFRLRNLVSPMVYDTSETEQLVGPLPFSLSKGVDKTVDWYTREGVRA